MWTGFFLLGRPEAPGRCLEESFHHHHLRIGAAPSFFPFTLGALTLSVLGALLAYPLGLLVIARYRKTTRNATGPIAQKGPT